MKNYQKAIKVKKVCESRTNCAGCIYANNCANTEILFYTPASENIEEIAKAIKIEKWNVK